MIALLLACSGDPEITTAPEPAGPLTVSTTDWPAHYLVERIGGQHVSATCILPAGEDPPAWQPPGEVVAALADADLIVTNGAGFSAWMATASLPSAKVVETATAVELIEFAGATHSHGVEGDHSHAGIDPHTWSDPQSYGLQAGTVRDALTGVDPDHAEAYAANTAALLAELEVLDQSLAVATADLVELEMAANHPAFNYLARRYDLSIQSFDVEGEALGAWAEGREDPVMLWETTPGLEIVGLRDVELDPLDSGEPYDYLAQARANVVVLDGIL